MARGADVTLAEEPIIEVTRVSDKGQMVIPKEIRDRFNFTEGSKLLVVATDDTVILQRIETAVGSIWTKDLVGRAKGVTDKLGLVRG